MNGGACYMRNRTILTRSTLIAVLSFIAAVATCFAATLTVGQNSAIPTQRGVSVPISLASGAGEQVAAIQFDILFDYAILAGQFIPLPEFLSRRVRDSLVPKPAPDKKLCTLCGEGVEVCPAVPKAIELVNGAIVIDYKKCIRCYCCQEMCPSAAMKLRSGILAKLLNR